MIPLIYLAWRYVMDESQANLWNLPANGRCFAAD
jgi:hypothetical protein